MLYNPCFGVSKQYPLPVEGAVDVLILNDHNEKEMALFSRKLLGAIFVWLSATTVCSHLFHFCDGTKKKFLVL